MSLGKELYNLSTQTAKDGDLLRDAEKVWKPLIETLKVFAQKTGERGCNIFFESVTKTLLWQLEQLASKEEIEFMNWNSPSDDGHPGKPFEQIGVITWDSTWYFSKYPFKVSRYSMIVSYHDDVIRVKYIDSQVEGLYMV